MNDPTDTPEPADVLDIGDFAWAEEAIKNLVRQGIIQGMTVTDEGIIYEPEGPLTRAQLAKLIVVAFEFEGAEKDAGFTDVTEGMWHYEFIQIAYNNEIVNGTSDTTFEPDTLISRQDMVTMLIRALDKIGRIDVIKSDGEINAELEVFADKDIIADYARSSAATAVRNNIILGFKEDTAQLFKPLDNTNRAQAAVVIHRILG